ncbi:Bro-N domain-containing protein [uncultured Alistipes sp.]|uniref:BRO-N domain-containing protein n=1 Tax=uncultured Alistipes sp. TaxID=538949 RepID=UPI002626F27B|nr:Bro-N domain-containing protein [uncultured Alistipes sp.]
MSAIQIFQNDRFGEVRVTEVNGEPMFAATDVCNVLGYSNPSKAISDHVDEDERYNQSLERGGNMLFITESGLYSLILRSNKPNAKPFRKWVTSEVLPSIRKTGSYTMALPKTYSEALRQLADAVEAKEKIQLQLEVKTQQLDEAKDWFSIKRWAKEHCMNWRKVSWRALKAISAEHGLEVKKIFDGNYGEVNLYHRKAFAILYGK